jgi:hypothetical protein
MAHYGPKAFIDKDPKAIHELGMKGIAEFVSKTHAAATQEEFNSIASQWFDKAAHPYYKHPEAIKLSDYSFSRI